MLMVIQNGIVIVIAVQIATYYWTKEGIGLHHRSS